jgi:hypothetical protein
MIPMTPEMGAYETMGRMIDGKKGQGEVNYRQATEPSHSCATCTRFQPPADCAIVAGKVSESGLCDAWSAEEEPDEMEEEDY